MGSRTLGRAEQNEPWGPCTSCGWVEERGAVPIQDQLSPQRSYYLCSAIPSHPEESGSVKIFITKKSLNALTRHLLIVKMRLQQGLPGAANR